MSDNEFRQPVSVDAAPEGSVCEWCGKPAEHAFTALGGKHHNTSGFYCQSCGKEFIRVVASSLSRETIVIDWEEPVVPLD
jgi:transposase-like protein